jgi:hypothetical protein
MGGALSTLSPQHILPVMHTDTFTFHDTQSTFPPPPPNLKSLNSHHHFLITSVPWHNPKVKIKVKQSHYRPGQALRFPWDSGSQISKQSEHEGGNFVSLTHRPPLPLPLPSFLLEAEWWHNPNYTVNAIGGTYIYIYIYINLRIISIFTRATQFILKLARGHVWDVCGKVARCKQFSALTWQSFVFPLIQPRTALQRPDLNPLQYAEYTRGI